MKLPGLLSDLDEVLHPALSTSGLHEQGPGKPQERDADLLKQDAAEHPAIPPAGTTAGEEQAGADLDASIAAARTRIGL